MVTGRAGFGSRQNTRVSRMAGKTGRVANGLGLKRTLLEPKRIADLCRRYRDVLIFRITLRFHRLMANGTTLLGGPTPVWLHKNCIYKSNRSRPMRRHDLDMFGVRKADDKIRFGLFALRRLVKDLARIREGVPGIVTRRRICMTNGADHGRGALEKLLHVAF